MNGRENACSIRLFEMKAAARISTPPPMPNGQRKRGTLEGVADMIMCGIAASS